jgi:ArsR family transcriptional regulator
MARQVRNIVSFQADVVKALGHPLRIEIVNYLKGRERSVSQIIEHFKVDASVVSRQLAILKRAGILGSRKSGLSVYYRVAMACIPGFLNCIGRAIGGKFVS